MREGGWLDGFPLHLMFAGEAVDSRAPIVVVDEDFVGRLKFGHGNERAAEASEGTGHGSPIVYLCRDFSAAVTASAAAAASSGLTNVASSPAAEFAITPALHLVANQAALPFRATSVSAWVQFVSGAKPNERLERIRVCRTEGSLVRVADSELPDDWYSGSIANSSLGDGLGAVPGPHPRAASASFDVRPESGAEYFVTRIPAPTTSPFRNLQLGKSAAIRERLRSWVPLPKPSGLRIEVSSSQLSFLDEDWPKSSGQGLFVKANWTALLLGNETHDGVVKYPLFPDGAGRLQAEADQLVELREQLPSKLAELVPLALQSGTRGEQFFLRQSARPGVPIPLRWWRPNWTKTAYRSASRFLIELQAPIGEVPPLRAGQIESLLAGRSEVVARMGRGVDPDFDLSELCRGLVQRLEGERVPLVRTHGDFWGGNLLAEDGGSLSGVLDWDASEVEGWPMMDLYHLLTYRKKRQAYWKFGSVVTDWLLPEAWSSWEGDLVDQYTDALHLDASHRHTLKSMYWLERVYQWSLTNSSEEWFDPDWVQRNVVEPLPKLLSSLRDRET